MQDRYAGDIGDYVKLALLRRLAEGRTLGLAWYRYPDEGHNADGNHTAYLDRPEVWRGLDPALFDALGQVVSTGRSIAALEREAIAAEASHRHPLDTSEIASADRPGWRSGWFQGVLGDMAGQEIVFADPDNGLVDDDPKRRRVKTFGKSIPLEEARSLAEGRVAVIYHHNTRRKGGHTAEVSHWLEQFGSGAMAVRANAWSCRTFFILNPDEEIRQRAAAFARDWRDHRVSLQTE